MWTLCPDWNCSIRELRQRPKGGWPKPKPRNYDHKLIRAHWARAAAVGTTYWDNWVILLTIQRGHIHCTGNSLSVHVSMHVYTYICSYVHTYVFHLKSAKNKKLYCVLLEKTECRIWYTLLTVCHYLLHTYTYMYSCKLFSHVPTHILCACAYAFLIFFNSSLIWFLLNVCQNQENEGDKALSRDRLHDAEWDAELFWLVWHSPFSL